MVSLSTEKKEHNEHVIDYSTLWQTSICSSCIWKLFVQYRLIHDNVINHSFQMPLEP